MAAPLLPPNTTICLNSGAERSTDDAVVAIAAKLARQTRVNFLEIRRPADDGHVLLTRGIVHVWRDNELWTAQLQHGKETTRANAAYGTSSDATALARLVALVADKTEAADRAAPLRTFVLRLDPRYGKIRTAATEQHRRVPNVVEMLARHGWTPTKAMPPWKDARGNWVRPEPFRKPDGMYAFIEEPNAAHIADKLVARRVVEPLVAAQEGEAA